MQSTSLKSTDVPFGLAKADPNQSAFIVTGRQQIALRAPTTINIGGQTVVHAEQIEITFDPVTAKPGEDFVVVALVRGTVQALPWGDEPSDDAVIIGGFHYAPGGNAEGVTGGDDIPAINPFSCWDLNYRPVCNDPRGMALINGSFWCDIYLTSATPADGTSRFGAPIADGNTLPDGFKKFDFESAKAVLAQAGKQLLGAEEFFAATYGVTERSSADHDPKVTGLDAARTSRHGIMQATGNMWAWGTDGHPDIPRASLLGGSWCDGSIAGSRYAGLDFWPVYSVGSVGARGRSDHLIPA